jgi:hypothetical protein
MVSFSRFVPALLIYRKFLKKMVLGEEGQASSPLNVVEQFSPQNNADFLLSEIQQLADEQRVVFVLHSFDLSQKPLESIFKATSTLLRDDEFHSAFADCAHLHSKLFPLEKFSFLENALGVSPTQKDEDTLKKFLEKVQVLQSFEELSDGLKTVCDSDSLSRVGEEALEYLMLSYLYTNPKKNTFIAASSLKYSWASLDILISLLSESRIFIFTDSPVELKERSGATEKFIFLGSDGTFQIEPFSEIDKHVQTYNEVVAAEKNKGARPDSSLDDLETELVL